ncbi:MAG: polysaccharide deacetylase family protein [Nibricoccus sp.]
MSPLILNFHGVGPVTREIDAGEFNCWLDQGFFETVLNLVRGQSHIQLTFDDGNVSDLELALPALQKRGLKATFFICSGRLDQSTFLKPNQVIELQIAGMEIGSHGINHVPWRRTTADELHKELAQSKETLEHVCGKSIQSAACPFGSYDRRVLSGLRQAGYQKVFTSDGGTASPRQWLQARTTITRSMSLDAIRKLVQKGPGLRTQMLINARKFIKRLR